MLTTNQEYYSFIILKLLNPISVSPNSLKACTHAFQRLHCIICMRDEIMEHADDRQTIHLKLHDFAGYAVIIIIIIIIAVCWRLIQNMAYYYYCYC